MAEIPQSRRGFLASIAIGIGSLWLLGRYLTPKTIAKRTVLVRAARQDVPVDGALVFAEQRLALLRDGERFYAVSLVCTHLGCTLNVAPDGLSCPCHGSRFDRQGKVLKGPADRALQRYEVVERAGGLEVVTG